MALQEILRKKIIVVLFLLSAGGGLSTLLVSSSVRAADLSQFQAGRIIDDRIFTDDHSMSASQIQDFLNQKNSVCLKDFRTLSLHDDNGDGIVQDSSTEQYGPSTMSVAEVLAAASDIYNINPKVLLVTLQKEQGLVTRSDCPSWRYNTAFGYGCPDTAPCDESAFGFTRQVDYAAYHFRGYFDDNLPSVPYGVGSYRIAYNPDSSCGSSMVNIQNRATAALYSYTPYQPNQAALAAGYGEAPCGAYGNRNFFHYFNDWFGSTYSDDTIKPHPDGTLVSMDGKIFLIENGVRRHIGGGSVFDSYRFSWNRVKPATAGDRNLPSGQPMYSLNPERLYRAPGTGVYALISGVDGAVLQKQLVSYQSFTTLGYSWSDVMLVNQNELPSATSDEIYNSNRHRNGDLVSHQGKVYLIDHNTRRYITGAIYTSHGWPWGIIMPATQEDIITLPEGERTLYKEGSVLHDGSNIYIIKLPPAGYEIKHPIGPWECYSKVFKYTSGDEQRVSSSDLPANTGARITCL